MPAKILSNLLTEDNVIIEENVTKKSVTKVKSPKCRVDPRKVVRAVAVDNNQPVFLKKQVGGRVEQD